MTKPFFDHRRPPKVYAAPQTHDTIMGKQNPVCPRCNIHRPAQQFLNGICDICRGQGKTNSRVRKLK